MTHGAWYLPYHLFERPRRASRTLDKSETWQFRGSLRIQRLVSCQRLIDSLQVAFFASLEPLPLNHHLSLTVWDYFILAHHRQGTQKTLASSSPPVLLIPDNRRSNQSTPAPTPKSQSPSSAFSQPTSPLLKLAESPSALSLFGRSFPFQHPLNSSSSSSASISLFELLGKSNKLP